MTVEEAIQSIDWPYETVTKHQIRLASLQFPGITDTMVEEHAQFGILTLAAKFNPSVISKEILEEAINLYFLDRLPMLVRLETQLIEDEEG